MKGFFIINILFFNTNSKTVLTLPMLSRPVKAYRKLKTPVVEGCQKRNLIHHGLNCPGRCHRNNTSLKRNVFFIQEASMDPQSVAMLRHYNLC